MNQATIRRFPISPLLSVAEVRQITGWGYDEANRICRVYGVRCGGKPKSPLYIHRDTLDQYLRSPWELDEAVLARLGLEEWPEK